MGGGVRREVGGDEMLGEYSESQPKKEEDCFSNRGDNCSN